MFLRLPARTVAFAASAALIALVVVGCGGSSSNSPAASRSGPAIPSQSFSTHPAVSSSGYALGDTGSNPDQAYECAAKLSTDSGDVIAYSTVAGSDNAAATQFCAALESDTSWTAVQTIAGGSYETTPICHITTNDQKTTARIYTAKPNGDDSSTTQLCAALAQGFGAG